MTDITSRKVIEYVGDNRDVLRKIEQISIANQKLSRGLGTELTKSAKTVGDSLRSITEKFSTDPATGQLNQFGGAVDKISQKLDIGNGNFVSYTKSVKTAADGTQTVSSSFKDLDKNTVSLGENIKRLTSRAALTIPLWLVLRGAVMGVISVFKNGLNDIVEFDRALQKLGKNLQGTPEEIKSNFNVAREEITKFSLESGIGVENITKAIQRFATVGFDFETSLKAGIEATRLSVLLFGEAESTANAFARGLRALITDVTDTATAQDEISRALALTSELWETNAFELDELNQGIEKFAGTAKSMNFTIEETLTLLAALSTRGLNANRAGTLLRTSTQKLEQNLKQVSKVLGVEINPEMDRTFDVFVKVTNAIANLKKESGTISPAVSEAIGELFGGVRGGEPIRDLIADMENVNKTFTEFAKKRPDLVKFRSDFDSMNKTTFRQVEIMHNLNKETGKAFITGLAGADDFTGALLNINAVLSTLQSNAKRVGDSIREQFNPRNVLFGQTGAAPIFRKLFESTDIGKQFTEQLDIIDSSFKNRLADLFKDTKKVNNVTEKGSSNILRNTEQQAKAHQIIQEFELDRQKTGEIILENELERLKILGLSSSELALAKDYIIDTLKLHEEDDDILKRQLELNRTIKEEEKLRTESIVSNELELLKIRGATTRQLLEARIVLEQQTGLNQSGLDILKKQLDLQREITTEKLNQNKFSSDSLKIFQIAQKYGTEQAILATQFLKGNISAQSTMLGSVYERQIGMLREFFPQRVEQLEAERFFSEDGRNIPIPEREAIRSLNIPAVKTQIDNINVQIKTELNRQNIGQLIADSLAKEIKEGTQIQRIINDQIEKF